MYLRRKQLEDYIKLCLGGIGGRFAPLRTAKNKLKETKLKHRGTTFALRSDRKWYPYVLVYFFAQHDKRRISLLKNFYFIGPVNQRKNRPRKLNQISVNPFKH